MNGAVLIPVGSIEGQGGMLSEYLRESTLRIARVERCNRRL